VENDRVNEAILEKRDIERNAKTQDVSAESTLAPETYLKAPTMTYVSGNRDCFERCKG
jgi:hypothetical protein